MELHVQHQWKVEKLECYVIKLSSFKCIDIKKKLAEQLYDQELSFQDK